MIPGAARSRTQRAAGDGFASPSSSSRESPRKKITREALVASFALESFRKNALSTRSDHGAASVARGGGERRRSFTAAIDSREAVVRAPNEIRSRCRDSASAQRVSASPRRRLTSARDDVAMTSQRASSASSNPPELFLENRWNNSSVRTSSRVMAASASHASTNPAMAHARRAGWIASSHPRLSHAEPRRASAHRDAPTKTWDDDSFLERYVSSSRRLTHVSRARSNAPARSGARTKRPARPARPERRPSRRLRTRRARPEQTTGAYKATCVDRPCVSSFVAFGTRRRTPARASPRAAARVVAAEQLFLRRLGVVGVFFQKVAC